MTRPLPVGQFQRAEMPRFGITAYAHRFPKDPHDRSLVLRVLGAEPVTISPALQGLPRHTLTADFHCVTGWSVCGLRWGGVRFADFFARHLGPAGVQERHTLVLRGHDGYRTSLPLADLLAGEVLLADELNGQPLPLAHGAPLRLVAPAHYGYKSLKHLARMECHAELPRLKRALLAFLDHPRARIAQEERAQGLPGWATRHLFKPLIERTARQFQAALQRHQPRL
jgi:DMSO/TMAO reductase YedYZ molybdopterin-dependent catalytic subunit